jgi:hypothetical protein
LSAAIILEGAHEAIYFDHPEVLANPEGNVYAIRGKNEKVPIVRVFTETLAGIDGSKYRKPASEPL